VVKGTAARVTRVAQQQHDNSGKQTNAVGRREYRAAPRSLSAWLGERQAGGVAHAAAGIVSDKARQTDQT